MSGSMLTILIHVMIVQNMLKIFGKSLTGILLLKNLASDRIRHAKRTLEIKTRIYSRGDWRSSRIREYLEISLHGWKQWWQRLRSHLFNLCRLYWHPPYAGRNVNRKKGAKKFCQHALSTRH